METQSTLEKVEIEGKVMDLKAELEKVEVKDGDLVREREVASEIEKKLDLQVKKSMNLEVKVGELEKNQLSNQKKLSEVGKLVQENKDCENKVVEKKLAESLKPFDDLKQKNEGIVLNIEKNRVYHLKKDDNMLRNKVAEENKETDESFEGLLLEKGLIEQELVDSGKMFEELKRGKEEIIARKNQIEKKSLQRRNHVRPVKGMKTLGLIISSFMLIGFTIIPNEVIAIGYTVGGHHGWAPNVNYTLWKTNITFFRNDWLMFVYDSNRLNVLEVNKDDYQTCREDNPIHSWKKGPGRKLVPLHITKTYYFISGNEYCFDGVKLSVSIQDPPPPPSSNSAGKLKWCLSTLVILVLLSFLLS